MMMPFAPTVSSISTTQTITLRTDESVTIAPVDGHVEKNTAFHTEASAAVTDTVDSEAMDESKGPTVETLQPDPNIGKHRAEQIDRTDADADVTSKGADLGSLTGCDDEHQQHHSRSSQQLGVRHIRPPLREVAVEPNR